MKHSRTVRANGDLVREFRVKGGRNREQFVEEVRRHFRADPAARSYFSLTTLKRMEKGGDVYIANLRAAAEVIGVAMEDLIATDGTVTSSDQTPRRAQRPRGATTAGLVAAAEDDGRAAQHLVRSLQRTYTRIMVRAWDMVESGDLAPQFYWRAYWNFQARQFRLWTKGRIPDPVYVEWVSYRQREYRENPVVGRISYRVAWRQYARRVNDAKFVTFLEEVFTGRMIEALESALAAAVGDTAIDHEALQTRLGAILAVMPRKQPVRAPAPDRQTKKVATSNSSSSKGRR